MFEFKSHVNALNIPPHLSKSFDRQPAAPAKNGKKCTGSTMKSAKTATYSRNINKFIKKVSTKAAEKRQKIGD